jgi:hypothetical protein
MIIDRESLGSDICTSMCSVGASTLALPAYLLMMMCKWFPRYHSLAVAESNIASACFNSVSRFMSPPYVVRHSPEWSSLLSSFTISSIISSIKQVLQTSSYSNGCLLISKIFSSTVMFPQDSFITPVLQLIRVFAIAKKGHPNMIGT